MGKEQTFKRKEIKYLLNDAQYQLLLSELLKIAEFDSYGETRINNIYFDTPDYLLIRTSLDKPVYKEKLRLRTYGDTSDDSTAFIEIKKKYKGIVYKRRISTDYAKALEYMKGEADAPERSQVGDEIDEFLRYYKNLRPAMIIGYDRIAMAGKEDKEFRVTFDRNITWRAEGLDLRLGSEGREIIRPDQHLMEIKIPEAFPMELSRVMSEAEIFPVSISKYGRGYTDMIGQAISRHIKAYDYETINREVTGLAPEYLIKKGEVAYA